MRSCLTLLFILIMLIETASAQERRGRGGRSDDRLQQLLERIEELEKRLGETGTGETDEDDDELMKLLEDAEDMSGRQRNRRGNRQEVTVFKGQERQQSQLNPEISVTGDFFAAYSSSDDDTVIDPGDFTDGRNRFMMRDVGFHFMAPLDPFTRGKFMFGVPGEGDESLSGFVDEAYMEWLNMPMGINLKIGKYFNQFGILNRYHDHGLPQFDRPSALVGIFGNGNLGGFGISGNVLIPGLWAHANELDVEVAGGGDGIIFDDSSESFYGVVHFKNFWDVTRNTYFELGLSGAHGHGDKDADLFSTVGGVDVTCKWVPAGESHYKTVEFRTEAFLVSKETPADTMERMGFYSYIKSKMGQRRWVGVRFSYSEPVFAADDESMWDVSPTYDFWQSEFVMFRLQYSYTERTFAEEDHSLFLHTVWSMGPHKHEAY